MPRTHKAAAYTLLATFVLLTCGDTNAGTRPRRQPPAPQLIVCGMTGCFEVPPGCRHEMRRSGRGVVAVVLCDRSWRAACAAGF